MFKQLGLFPKTTERLGVWWCRLMHAAPMWPMRGRYTCRTCGRSYAVPWAEDHVVQPIELWIRREEQVMKRAA